MHGKACVHVVFAHLCIYGVKSYFFNVGISNGEKHRFCLRGTVSGVEIPVGKFKRMRCSLAVNIRNVFWVIGLRKLFSRLNGYGIKYIFVVVYVAGIVLKVSDFEAYGYVASAFPSGV